MKKAEYLGNEGCPQRDSAEHEEYAGARSADRREAIETDGADLLERILDRDNLNRAYKRVKANKGAPGIDEMTVEDALPWLREHREELLGYFGIASMRNARKEWDEWLRRRFRMYIWKQWKGPKARAANLEKLGAPRRQARKWGYVKGYWRVAGSPILMTTITSKRLAQAGYYSILDRYESLHLYG